MPSGCSGSVAPHVVVAGNLKFDSPPPPADPRTVSALQGMIAGRPVWVAASTHPGEEEMVVAIHRALARRYPKLLTIIAPRHPHRGEALAEIATDSALNPARRSLGEQPERDVDFYIADTIGELGLFLPPDAACLRGRIADRAWRAEPDRAGESSARRSCTVRMFIILPRSTPRSTGLVARCRWPMRKRSLRRWRISSPIRP